MRSVLTRWWLSNFLASFGDGLRLAAFPLLAAQITRSPTAIAAVVAAEGAPWLVIGPIAGVFVDRRGTRSVLVTMQLVQAAMILALVVAVIGRTDPLAVILLCALATGVVASLRSTASQAGTPQLIDAPELDRANGRLEAGTIIGSELLGPAGGGLLFGIAAALPFALNSGVIGLAVLLVSSLPGLAAGVPTQGRRPRARTELQEGLRWIAGQPMIRMLIVSVGVVAIADAAWFAILVLYVTRVLHRAPVDYGALLAVGALGGIAASIACASLTRRVGAARLMALSVVLIAGSQLVLGLTASLPVAATMLAVSSGAFAIFKVLAVRLRQRIVPAHLFGRVTSVYLATAGGAEAAGALLGGALATAAGVRAPMLLGVVPLLVVAGALLAAGRRMPAI